MCDPGLVIRELLLKLIAFPAAGCLVFFVASYTASITSPSKAIEPSTRFVQLIFAIGLGAGAVSLSAVCLRRPLGALAQAWLGILVDRPTAPISGSRTTNLRLAAADAGAFAVSLALGLWLFRTGVRDASLLHSVSGLLVAGSGVFFCLGTAVPRVLWAMRHPVGCANASGGELAYQVSHGSLVLALACSAAVGLSMGLAKTIPEHLYQGKVRPLAYGEWAEGCAGPDASPNCPAQARYALLPSEARALRLSWWASGNCRLSLSGPAGGRDALRLASAQLPRGGGFHNVRLQVARGEEVRITIEGTDRNVCWHHIRYGNTR